MEKYITKKNIAFYLKKGIFMNKILKDRKMKDFLDMCCT